MSSPPLPSSSPGRPRSLRFNTSFRNYVPLKNDDLFSPKPGLSGLIRSASSTSLSNSPLLRRRSIGDGNEDWDVEANGDRRPSGWGGGDRLERRQSVGLETLMTPHMRSMRLIGYNNPRYEWRRYWKSEEELKKMRKPIREYYERTNTLIQQYSYIDRLLDSSLPHDLMAEYHNVQGHGPTPNIPPTITESPPTPNEDDNPMFPSQGGSGTPTSNGSGGGGGGASATGTVKVKRTPKAIFSVPEPSERTPLVSHENGDSPSEHEGTLWQHGDRPDSGPGEGPDSAWGGSEEISSGHRIVTLAIYINFLANAILLIGKVIVTVMTSSLSVLASLIDSALDFLSTAIVWTTTKLISRQDQYAYPVGRRRLEPIGVLVFSVIMITSFFQVLLESFNRLMGPDHKLVSLTGPAIAIMASTVVVKFVVWLWSRFINNSSVQALAQDAMTDVVFNIFSIIFPLVGYYTKQWWMDALGGAVLSLYVIINWSRTSGEHIRNLTGAAATADERNVLLYLTMRFAKTIKQIQGLQAYHAGDKLNVEVDIVMDEHTSLRDSHDLGESLQYVLESVPIVDRAFVHMDYASYNLPSHMQQHDD